MCFACHFKVGRDGRMEGRNAQIGLNGHAWLQRGRITLWTHADATVSSQERSSGGDADGSGPPSRTILLDRPIAACTTGNSNETIDNRTKRHE